MRIAIIGSGIAGLGAAWLLRRKHEVTIFEQNDCAGGHAQTIRANIPGKPEPAAVDTGFMIYNETTYPNLVALLNLLKIPNEESELSFAVSLDDGKFEYAANNLRAMFEQKRNLVRPMHWLMLKDINRFFREAPQLLETNNDPTLGDYLKQENYGFHFIRDHLVPMAAALWNSTPNKILEFPARNFIRLFMNHGFLELETKKRQWRRISGSSMQMVQKILADCGASLRLNARIISVATRADSAGLRLQDGKEEKFDHIVIATHANHAIGMLSDATEREREILGLFCYRTNRALLHCDPKFMPHRRKVWSSWNYIGRRKKTMDVVPSVTYWINRIQNIDQQFPLFLTVNPQRDPAPHLALQEFTFEHPQFDQTAIHAQKSLCDIQGVRRLWFCGSYFGYGLHEDALASGLAVAEALGCARPWQVKDISPAHANAMARHHARIDL